MLRSLCRTILFRMLGWSEHVTIPHQDKCIICVAPHTSNVDFLLAQLYYKAIGRRAGFLMKREWFFWPLGILLRRMGGIAVQRSRSTNLTDQIAETAKAAKSFELAVTPEGTRSLVTTWKRGFYYIALKAKLPIQLYALDYKNKRICCTKEIIPTGNISVEMKEIMDYYRGFTGRHPEKFAVEEIKI